MRSTEFVTELFNQPYPVKIFQDQAVARDTRGRPLYVVFDRTPAWETVKVTFDRGGDFSLTDWRDEYRIMATVVEAVKQWAAKHQPGSMYFSVPQDEPTNRMRLYDRMVASLVQGTGYSLMSDSTRVDDEAISYYMARMGKRFGDDRFWWLVRDDLIKNQQEIKEDLSPEDAQALWIKNYGEEMAERVFYNIKNELLFTVSDLCSIRSSACDTKDRLEAMSRTEFARWVLTYFTDALEQNGWPEAHSEGIAQVIRDRVQQPLLNKQSLLENFADGKKPGRKGLSRRVGIPKKVTLGQLEKIAQSSTGERRRMAQWQLNMRRGRGRKNK